MNQFQTLSLLTTSWHTNFRGKCVFPFLTMNQNNVENKLNEPSTDAQAAKFDEVKSFVSRVLHNLDINIEVESRVFVRTSSIKSVLYQFNVLYMLFNVFSYLH